MEWAGEQEEEEKKKFPNRAQTRRGMEEYTIIYPRDGWNGWSSSRAEMLGAAEQGYVGEPGLGESPENETCAWDKVCRSQRSSTGNGGRVRSTAELVWSKRGEGGGARSE